MSLIRLQDATLCHHDHFLLREQNWALTEGKTCILVGENGVGKSSFLRLLAEQDNLSQGQISRQKDLRVLYLPQELPEIQADLVEACLQILAIADAKSVHAYFHDPELRPSHHRHEAQLIAMVKAWQADLAYWRLDAKQAFQDLSGGEQRKALLCCALADDWDIMLLDEPTNHLDIHAIEWLEERLLAKNAAKVIISHDRQFAGRLSEHFLEIDAGILYPHQGDFNSCLQAKVTRQALAERQQQKRLQKLEAEKQWLQKGVTGRRKRDVGRLAKIDELREHIEDNKTSLAKHPLTLKSSQSSQCLMKIQDLKMQIPPLTKLSLTITRGMKIGLVGANGSGKSSLIRAWLNPETFPAGTIEHGSNISMAYFDQHLALLDTEANVLDFVGQGSLAVNFGGQSMGLHAYLKRWGLSSSQMHQRIASLSGGWQQRVALASLLIRPVNFLILDEPSNNLDIHAMATLESLLSAFDGSLVLISHDRSLLANVCTHTLYLDGQGGHHLYHGPYQAKTSLPEKTAAPAQKSKNNKKERVRAHQVGKSIEKAEQKRTKLAFKQQDPNLYHPTTDHQAIHELQKQISCLDTEIEALYEELMELDDKLNQDQ